MKPSVATRNYSKLLYLILLFQAEHIYAQMPSQANYVFEHGKMHTEKVSAGNKRLSLAPEAISIHDTDIAMIASAQERKSVTGDRTKSIELRNKALLPGIHIAYINLTSIRGNALDVKSQLILLQDTLSAQGVTSVSGPATPQVLDGLRQLYTEKGSLKLRFDLWGELDSIDKAVELRKIITDLPQDFFRYQTVFAELDGDFSDHSAALSQPYSDNNQISGVPRFTQNQLNELIYTANKKNFAVAIRANGDRAITMAIHGFAYARKMLFNTRLRNRIIGCHLIPEALLGRFNDLNITAVLLPEKEILGKEIGPRAKTLNQWDHLLKEDATVAVGSLWPQTPIDTLKLFQLLQQGSHRLDAEQAWNALSHGGAYATHAEHVLGSIREGKFADLVVTSEDPFIPAHQKKTKILMTFSNGKLVYDSSTEK